MLSAQDCLLRSLAAWLGVWLADTRPQAPQTLEAGIVPKVCAWRVADCRARGSIAVTGGLSRDKLAPDRRCAACCVTEHCRVRLVLGEYLDAVRTARPAAAWPTLCVALALAVLKGFFLPLGRDGGRGARPTRRCNRAAAAAGALCGPVQPVWHLCSVPRRRSART